MWNRYNLRSCNHRRRGVGDLGDRTVAAVAEAATVSISIGRRKTERGRGLLARDMRRTHRVSFDAEWDRGATDDGEHRRGRPGAERLE